MTNGPYRYARLIIGRCTTVVRPSLALLGVIVGLSGLFAALIPSVSSPICNAISRTRSIGPMMGPLLSSVILFVIPSTLLGMVSPYSVRLLAREVSGMGNLAGRLYALSTAGSIVGTLGTAFVLLPNIGTRKIIWSLGLLLFLLGGAVLG